MAGVQEWKRFAVAEEDGTKGCKDVASCLGKTGKLSCFFRCAGFHGESDHEVREKRTNGTSNQGIDDEPVEKLLVGIKSMATPRIPAPTTIVSIKRRLRSDNRVVKLGIVKEKGRLIKEIP